MGHLEAAARRLRQNLTPSLLLLFILLLAALLRFYQLSGHSLWSDEGNSVALARRSFGDIAQRTAFDIHPPFYYWLLKSWIFVWGDTEGGLRSLSVILGVALVGLTGGLGSYLFNRRAGLISAFIAALSPLQVYYSQEARMYILLAFLGGLTILLAFLLLDERQQPRRGLFSLLYILVVSAGLYTHYAYPLMLLLANLAALARFRENRQLAGRPQLLYWLGLQLIPLSLYLPWLPIAWRQVTTWPSEQQPASLPEIIASISTTLLAGLSWPYGGGLLLAAGVLLLLVIVSFIKPPDSLVLLLWLWLLLPVCLTVFIFSPAFLKFLLIASPALALLLALAVDRLLAGGKATEGSTASFWLRTQPRSGRAIDPILGVLLGSALLLLLSGISILSLRHYYTDPTYARDNYRGIVQFIKAVGEKGDAVVLNAEGQQDVFNYYTRRYHLETPVYPLPRRRPLDEAATLAELKQITTTAGEIYGVYWANHQADPAGLIEGWLDTHLFKATDQWYGNVRLVSYAVPQTQLDPLRLSPVNERLGDHIQLTGYALTGDQIRPGDILQIVLQWQALEPLSQDYTLFLQLLDPANHLVGQRDAPPGQPASTWPSGEAVLDSHGIFIEPGTPPGKHRLIVGMVDPSNGRRLPVSQQAEELGDFIELGEVEIIPSAIPLPAAAFHIQVPVQAPLAELSLLGYDLYKLGHRSTPETPLHPGDPLQVVAYWRLDQPVAPGTGPLSITVVTRQGLGTPVSVVQPLASAAYPPDRWRVGEIVRAQYVLFLSNLEPGAYRLEWDWQGQKIMTKPFQVE